MLTHLWFELGFIRWPLLFSLAAVLVLTVWSAGRLFRREASADDHTKAWVDAILFWGAFAVVSGVLGTLIGIIIAAQFVEMAGEISTSLIWGGVRVSLLSSAVGFLILAFAALSWFVLRLKWRFLEADRAGAPA